MTKDEIIALAKECGASTFSTKMIYSRKDIVFCLHELQKFAQHIRNATLKDYINMSQSEIRKLKGAEIECKCPQATKWIYIENP